MSFRPTVVALAILAHGVVAVSGDPGWQMPGVHGNVPNGWAPGRNWTTNPFTESGGTWTAYHEVDGRLMKMVSGRAYSFHFVLRDPGDSFAPRCMLLGRKLQAAMATAPGAPGPASLGTGIQR
jgi:hypothetical protein